MEKALAYLHQQRGKYFDPQCLDAFVAQLDRVGKIQFMLGDRQEAASC